MERFLMFILTSVLFIYFPVAVPFSFSARIQPYLLFVTRTHPFDTRTPPLGTLTFLLIQDRGTQVEAHGMEERETKIHKYQQ